MTGYVLINNKTIIQGWYGESSSNSNGTRHNEGHNLGLPIIISSYDSIYSSYDPNYPVCFNGFTIDSTIAPITLNVTSSYTVPSGKIIVILNIYNSSNDITIDSKIILSGRINYNPLNFTSTNMYTSFELKQPLFFDENQVIDGWSNCVINGYFIDK